MSPRTIRTTGPVVYIAGPYTAPDYLGIDRNISIARDAAKWLTDNDFYYFCPHMNSAHMGEACKDKEVDFWYSLDITILDRCDALLLVGDWQKSSGTLAEIDFADKQSIPTFYDRDHLIPWRSGRYGTDGPQAVKPGGVYEIA